ncbi:hypothetical protein IJ674_07730 [bacterium]|nr:hypothetical protein [bacterium]
MKIFQINGFRGLVMTAFIVCCLFAGFVIFPGVVAMYLWNKYLVNLLSFPTLSLFQGVLLWGITAVSYFIISNGKLPVSFETPDSLSDAELNMIMKQARISSDLRKINSIMKNRDTFSKATLKSDNKTGMTSPMSEKQEDEENIKIGNLK